MPHELKPRPGAARAPARHSAALAALDHCLPLLWHQAGRASGADPRLPETLRLTGTAGLSGRFRAGADAILVTADQESVRPPTRGCAAGATADTAPAR